MDGQAMAEAPELPLEVRRDGFGPVAELARARDDEGVIQVETPLGVPAHLVCRYGDVREVLSDATRFSSASVTFTGTSEVDEDELARRRARSLLSFDPPEHTRLKQILVPEFTVQRMRRFEPRIAEIVQTVLNDLEQAGRPADLVTNFARRVPSLVISELVGVPYTDPCACPVKGSLGDEQDTTADWGNREYIATLVAQAQAEPRGGILGMLIREHGTDLSSDELIGIVSLLLLAGRETTVNMLSLGTLALLQRKYSEVL
jgi:cytochrome P450